jgi:F-type H+-transporting ATPase subunit b
MDQILSTVGELLLKAVPTIVLFVFLYFFLKLVLFGPLGKVLAERDAKTAGARDSAARSLKRADDKATALEAALREARNELYKEQEATRREWINSQADQLKSSRAEAEDKVTKAKADLAAQAEVAKGALGAQTTALADQIAKSLLENGA